MKIYPIKKANADTKPLDLKKFTAELQELSERYGLQLVSIGAMSTVDSAGPAYLAIWATEAEPIEN